MTDLAAAGRADAAGLADRERREVIVQHERLFVRSLQRVDPLLILAGAERGDHDRLRLTAGEQRRAVGARQYADLGDNRAHGFHVTAVDALAGVENVPAHDLGLEVLERDCRQRERVLVTGGELGEGVLHLGLCSVNCIVSLHLVGNRVGGPQVGLDQFAHLFLDRRIVRHRELARLFGGLLGEPDDRVDHRLEMPVAEHHRAEHDVLGQLLGLQLDHQNRVRRAGDDEVELAFRHLVNLRVQHVFVVDEADAGAADRAHERRAAERQRRRRRHHRDDVGIVLEIVRQRGDDDLGVAAPTVGEQRPHRPVDQAGGQRLLLGRPSFALEVAAGDAACGVELLLVVDRQRQEVDAGLGLLRRDHGRDHGGFAVGGDDRAVGLARDLAGFQS